MSVNYGGPPAGGMPYGGGGAAYAPPGKVNFGWINEAFDLFKLNWGVWVLAVLTLIVVPAVIGGIVGALFGASNAASGGVRNPAFGRPSAFTQGLPIGLNLVIQAFSIAFQAFMYGGLYHMAVKQVRNEPISFADIFSGGPFFLPMLGFTIIYGLASGIGFLLLIVPGLLVLSLLLPGFALIADGEGVSNAISRSVEAMKRDMWSGVGLIVVMGLVMLVGLIPCGLGTFVTYPMLWIVSALAYRDMVGMPAGAGGYAQPGFGAPAAPGVWPPAPSAAPPPTSFPPASAYGQAPPPTSFGQTPPPASQAPPAPSWGQPQPPANPEPPRRSLGGDPMDETPPPSSGPQ